MDHKTFQIFKILLQEYLRANKGYSHDFDQLEILIKRAVRLGKAIKDA